MIPESQKEESSRFLKSDAFITLFNGVVGHIFKSKALLGSLQGSITDLISSFEDCEILHKIAENFSTKKDNDSAEKVYSKILEINHSDERALRKRAYLIALRDPECVNEEDLPPIELVEDAEKLRSIEANFLTFKKVTSTSRPQSTIIIT